MSKKTFLLGSLFLIFISINVSGLTYGDVNNNGIVDIIDALITAQFCVGQSVPNFDNIAGNVDAKNGITIVDALMIAQFSTGLIDKFPADDLQPTPTPTLTPTLTPTSTPTPTPVSDSENIINGDFTAGITNWTGGFYAPGAGSISVSNGELHISITNAGTATWNIQISQGNLNIISGKEYKFSFDARSISIRTIEANVGMSGTPYTSYFASGPLSISTSMTSYSFTFTASADDATARVEFNCGLDANDLYIDNISLIGGSGSTPEPTPSPVIINFSDPNLETAIRTKINISDGPIYNTDVYTLSSLDLSLKNLTDITGLEYFNGLTNLILTYNNLLEITPLKDLSKLRELILGANHLSNITPLQNLTNLTRLTLVVNEIKDVSPLANLTNLTFLEGECNEITDITPLANLTKVTYLTLYENDIKDITPLKNLTNVTYLDLSDNEIADISPLANLTKLTDLNLSGNPISDITALQNLTNLRTLVLNVKILKDIAPLANLNKLVSLNLVNNSISDITPLKNLTNLKVLFIEGNPLDQSAQAVIDSLWANGTRVVYN